MPSGELSMVSRHSGSPSDTGRGSPSPAMGSGWHVSAGVGGFVGGLVSMGPLGLGDLRPCLRSPGLDTLAGARYSTTECSVVVRPPSTAPLLDHRMQRR